jgi:sterol desaturase/sphingolipid hydroxylase (fatty acid hydroxylase superfamily)
MNPSSIVATNAMTVVAILSVMALVALLETAIPLHARGPAHRAHAAPNLALTFITFATNAFLNGGLMALLLALERHGFGILRWAHVDPHVADVAAVVLLDFSFYVAHVSMHWVPAFWKVHRVHHSDPVVDVTTTIRQHPLEGLIRYAFMAVFAAVLGVSIPAFAVYRVASALNGLLEHANLRVPRRLDAALSLVTTWPYMHKLHHSRDVQESSTNYGNLFSFFDRLFGTYTPSSRGANVVCGVDGLDAAELQTTRGLLALPLESAAKSVSRSAP